MTVFELPKVFFGCGVLAVAAQCWAVAPPATNCADLLKMRIENATISEAVDVPAGKPLSVGGVFGPPVVVTSLPAHCLVHGEVDHHKGTDGKDYGDRFEIRMPVEWQRLRIQQVDATPSEVRV
jgi:hypothetical protein